jgi:hypothetical protein
MMTIDFRKNRINILVLGIGFLALTLLTTRSNQAQEKKKAQEKKNAAVASTAALDASTAASGINFILL